MSPATAPSITVIVVCWNAANVLERCFACLRDQDYERFDVVVVDDGSDDDSVDLAVEALVDERFSVVRSPLNRGTSAARNLGLRYATGDIVAFIDADGYAHPDWLQGLATAYADPTVGAAASVVFFDGDPLILNGTGGTVNQQWWATDINFLTPLPSAGVPGEVLYPMGCGLSVRRAVAQAVGPFDERIFNYYDDVDFGIRVWRAGWRVVLAREAMIDHGFGQSSGASQRKQLLCERHRMRVAVKHSPLRRLPGWALQEALAYWRAPTPRHEIKREAITWNLRSAVDLLRQRIALRGRPRPPAHVFDPSPGERFVAEPALPGDPDWAEVGPTVEICETGNAGLAFGWHPPEHEVDYWFSWAGQSAAVVLCLEEPAERLRIQFRQPGWAVGPLALEVRGITDPARGWSFTLPHQGPDWRTEELAARLAPGRYVVFLTAAGAAAKPPDEGRVLGVALRALEAA